MADEAKNRVGAAGDLDLADIADDPNLPLLVEEPTHSRHGVRNVVMLARTRGQCCPGRREPSCALSPAIEP